MSVLVGIDEAGYGPILGPLVVSSSAFSLPKDLLKSDLWQILRKSLSDKRSRLAGRLLIADSKKAYNRSLGIKHLERTTLTLLKCLATEPTTLIELMELLCPDCLGRLGDYPWYADIGTYHLSTDTADRGIASSVFTDDTASNGIKLLAMQSCCLDVAYYNNMVNAVKNKSNVLFGATSHLIKKAYDDFGQDDLHIVVDRQGGRVHYRKNLQLMFGDMQLKILLENPKTSSYELKTDGKSMRVHFVVGADKRFMPVSLASMVSKYLRELLIDNINRYFIGFNGNLKPTAGYWQDGLRFISDIEKSLPNIKFDSNLLIRCR